MEETFEDIPYRPDDIRSLRERLFLTPQDTDAMGRLALLLEQSGNLPGAIDLYQRALRVDPYRTDILVCLGRLWNDLGDTERAAYWLKRALTIDPDCAEAGKLLAALAAGEGLTPIYIKTLFDQYADRFDAELIHTLHYRAPELVAAMLGKYGAGKCGTISDCLDLGCGTGLSGQALRPYAARLDGLDLSSGMIAKARARGIYDVLTVAEAHAFLAAGSSRWGLIAAVDMLNYIGDLAPIVRAAAARLSADGLLAGTVEKNDGEDFVLTPKRRHMHSYAYLTAAIAASGLKLLEISEAVLRHEGGKPVAGLVFAARKSSAY